MKSRRSVAVFCSANTPAEREAKQHRASSAKVRASSLSRANVVRVRLEGANSALALRGESKLNASTNYFVGNDPAESAILITLAPGQYTAIVSGLGATPTGVGLVESYDLGPP